MLRAVRPHLLVPVFACAVLCACALTAHADGMQPESSLILLYEQDGETAMNVRNTDPGPALLHTTVLDIAEDSETVVIATPPVARVEPGQEQMVRFIYQGPPLQVQRLKRVVFEGIGQATQADGRAVVGVGVRQNLPMLLHPKGLARNDAPWKLLQWSSSGRVVSVTNPSAYVVRLAPTLTLVPSGRELDLGRSYLLPGQSVELPLPEAPVDTADTHVQLQPASVYGFITRTFDAPLN